MTARRCCERSRSGRRGRSGATSRYLLIVARAAEDGAAWTAQWAGSRRVLRPGGALVLSRLHPAGDWLRHGGSYVDVRTIEETCSTGWTVRYWFAPLATTCQEIYEAGFFIERLSRARQPKRPPSIPPSTSGSAASPGAAWHSGSGRIDTPPRHSAATSPRRASPPPPDLTHAPLNGDRPPTSGLTSMSWLRRCPWADGGGIGRQRP